MKKYFLIILLISCILPACKKDPPSDYNGMIIGKWSILPTRYELYTNGSLASTSTGQYTPGDYGDFRSNGTFQTLTNGTVYNNQYRIEGDSIIFDNVNKAKIKTLTLNNLSYYFTDTINSTQYRVNTFNFKK